SPSPTSPNSLPTGDAPKPIGDTRRPVAPSALRSMFFWLRNGLHCSKEENVPANPNDENDRRRAESSSERVCPSGEKAGCDGSNHGGDLVPEVQDSADLSGT